MTQGNQKNVTPESQQVSLDRSVEHIGDNMNGLVGKVSGTVRKTTKAVLQGAMSGMAAAVMAVTP